MTTLTVLGGPVNHPTTTPTTYLLATSVISSQTTTSTTTSPSLKIAPKRQRQESSSSDQSYRATTKRRSPGNGAPPAVARRNERERNRVRQVNMGFATLRQHVPNGAKSKKMSKVETLRSAVEYIKQLQELLNDEEMMNDEENSVPSFDEQFRHLRPSSQHQQTTNNHGYGDGLMHLAAGTTVGFGGLTPVSSPTPSLGSDASSPYDSLSPEDEELLDFTTWLS